MISFHHQPHKVLIIVNIGIIIPYIVNWASIRFIRASNICKLWKRGQSFIGLNWAWLTKEWAYWVSSLCWLACVLVVLTITSAKCWINNLNEAKLIISWYCVQFIMAFCSFTLGYLFAQVRILWKKGKFEWIFGFIDHLSGRLFVWNWW